MAKEGVGLAVVGINVAVSMQGDMAAILEGAKGIITTDMTAILQGTKGIIACTVPSRLRSFSFLSRVRSSLSVVAC